MFFYVVYYVDSMFPRRIDTVGKRENKGTSLFVPFEKKNGLIALNLAPIFNHSIKKKKENKEREGHFERVVRYLSDSGALTQVCVPH